MTRGSEELVTGIVEHVGLYESTVGVRDRCVVFVRIGAEPRMLVFDADIRDHLPVGRRMQLRFRRAGNDEAVTLLERKVL